MSTVNIYKRIENSGSQIDLEDWKRVVDELPNIILLELVTFCAHIT